MSKSSKKPYPFLMSDDEWILEGEEWICSSCRSPRKLVAPDFGRSWLSSSNGVRAVSNFDRIMSGMAESFDSCPCRS